MHLIRGLIGAGAVLGLAAPAIQAEVVLPRASAPHWSYVWRSAPRLNILVRSIATTGPDHAWAAAEGCTESSSGCVDTGYLVRWNGRVWRQLDLPPTFSVDKVRASSPDDVWVFGLLGAVPVALRGNGTAWQTVALPRVRGFTQAAVFALDDAWYAGLACVGGRCLYRWDGQSWSSVPLPAGFKLTDLSGTSDRNLWIAGRTAVTHRIEAYQWTGRSWLKASLPTRHRGSNWTLVDAAAPGNVWLVSITGVYSAQIWHASTGRWSELRGGPWMQRNSRVIAPYGRNGIWDGPCLLWTGARWLTPCATSRTPEAFAMATVPGSRSTWLGTVYPVSRTWAAGAIALSGPLP